MAGSRFLAFALATSAMAVAGSSPVNGQCRLCDTPTTVAPTDKAGQDVTLELETSIDFGRLVVSDGGEGSAALRPDGSTAANGSVQEMSPRATVGSAVVQGEPGKAIRVELPTRIVLTSVSGAQIVFEDVVSDLPSMPRLDSSGRLTFHIGGSLRVRGDAEGQYRGDLPITVEYL